jgi:hypothetical protein
MPTKSAKSSPKQSPVALSHRLHALLHSVRTIAHFEDELCTLLHATEHAKPSPADLKDLRKLLSRIPASDYLDDLEAVRAVIDIPAPRQPRAAKKLSSKSKTAARKPLTAKAASAKSKAAAKPQARKTKS